MNLVAECTTMSAPCSNGRHRCGVARVASTTRGIPCSRATVARADRSATIPEGLATTSVYRALVSGRMAAAKAEGSSVATNVVSMPSRRHEPIGQGVGAALGGGAGHRVDPRPGEGGEGEQLGRLAARRGDGADP